MSQSSLTANQSSLSNAVGLGLRPELFQQIRSEKPTLGFLEAHSENYFDASFNRDCLLELAGEYPISLHGVGLSLGRADELDLQHLKALRELVNQVDPIFVSEHLAWSAFQHQHVPDLLPLPLNQQSFKLLVDHIKAMQDALGRQVLIENPSNYALFRDAQWPEHVFLNELAASSGCGLLLDVNNVYVSASNLGESAQDYIAELDSSAIQEYHLAGYSEVIRDDGDHSSPLLIDTHNQPVHTPVWELFSATLEVHGSRPTLIEWDADIPDFSVLQSECDTASSFINAAQPPKTRRRQSVTQRNQTMQNQPLFDFHISDYQSQFLDSVLSLRETIDVFESSHRDRISIYQNNIDAALCDYLAEVYPAVQGVLGVDYFRQLCRQFYRNQLPEQGNLHSYGQNLYRTFAQVEALGDMHYLNDLAAYEWALHAAYFSPVFSHVGAVLKADSAPEEDLLGLSVRLNTSVVLIKSNYPVLDIHEQSLPTYAGKVAINLEQSGDRILVCKRGVTVETLRLSECQYALMQQLSNVTSLQSAIDKMSADAPQQELSEALAYCFTHDLLEWVDAPTAQ